MSASSEVYPSNALVRLLAGAAEHDTDYEVRNRFVLFAVAAAVADGVPVGFRIDPGEPEWPVVYFELPTGQVSWHLPQHERPWDGHTTEEKLWRIRELSDARLSDGRRP